ncbi:MAG: 16S rRNA processing protein RimM [Sphingobacteriales bacterium]|nr:16S rRNA processing protein RimM [Sphingobacteriales bacterium]MBI3717229.1 16S rRNA processing protein RimM [Sphingobacteriales bacterium]
MTQYFKIGKLVATFGVDGKLVLKHSLGKKTSLKRLETIFLEERKDSFLPYFIENTTIKTDSEIYIKLEGTNTKEAAHKLTQKEVWLAEVDFKKFAAKSSPISLLGFHLINEGEDIGEILEVIEQPMQVLCKIMLNDNEALIPLHEETLQKVDKKKKEIHVILPEGLLDIYR